MLTQEFKNELFWQNIQRIYNELAYYKTIDIKFEDANNDTDIVYALRLLTVSTHNHQELYNEFLNTMEMISKYFLEILPQIQLSIENLEQGLEKNKIENFDLNENERVYRLYTRLLFFLKFIKHSGIHNIDEFNKDPYLPINEVIYYGAIMSIITKIKYEL